MIIAAWLGALAIGVSLGLLGSGGSIVTVPVLVYLVGQPDKVAIASSLAIVGGISLIGAVPFALSRRISWRSVLFFGLPGMAGSFLGAYIAQYVSGTVQLLLFAGIMLLAAIFMLRPEDTEDEKADKPHALWKIGLEGLTVGAITGLVGVGGGFLIVPALALLGGLPMHIAIGTSLLIIALKSFVGFFEYLNVLTDLNLTVDWNVVFIFIGLGVVGGFLGNRLGRNMPQELLKRVFAVFLLAMGAFILYQNVPKVL
jgi:uncharacterized membrane protein YfcA